MPPTPASAHRLNTIAGLAAALEPGLTIVKPDGDGPFPVVFLLHGCGGRKAFMDRWAGVARDGGAAAVVIDSYAHRGISRLEAYATVCMGLRLWGRERAGDLFAAMLWARRQPWADTGRFIAAGWSHGGWTVMDALAMRTLVEMREATGLLDLHGEPLAGLAAAFLMYPYCGTASLSGRGRWRLRPRTLAILGGDDTIVGQRAPRRALERVQASGVPMEIVTFPEATHAFDEPETTDIRVRFNPSRAREAERRLVQLIATVRATT
jgi:dienelactone hydrolase